MEFACGTGYTRPVRLSAETRAFADRSMHGVYGDDAMTHKTIAMDTVPGFAEMDGMERYSHAVDEIARRAPIRLIPGEKICGAATLGGAISHIIPVTFGGENVLWSVSHVTVGFDRVLEIGMNGILHDVDENCPGTMKRYLRRMVYAMRIWHARYLAAERDNDPEIAAMLRRVPFETPRTFREAVQSLWFTFAFTRLCGNWSGIGRIDKMLGPYLEKDLAENRITLDEAREILAHFFIKGCEWIQSDTPTGTGDAQHYQNIVLSGTDRDGHDVTNEVTYLVLDIVEELAISDYPITVRLTDETDERLYRRIAEVMRYGGGILAVYNEPLILRSLTAFGYDPAEARDFANDGCWEVQIPGRTNFTYMPFDAYTMLMRDTLGIGGTHRHYDTYDALLAAYMDRLQKHVDDTYAGLVDGMCEPDGQGGYRLRCFGIPATLISLFERDCIAAGLDYNAGGCRYTVRSPHIGGAPDAGNSLYAIRKAVFEDHLTTLDHLLDAIENDWEDEEILRQRILTGYTYYGNDNEEADAVTAEILDRFADMVLAHKGESPILYIPGVSTFGRQIDWLGQRTASPFGMKKGAILAGNASPTPGTDKEGATAIIESYCLADLEKQVCGAALDVKLHPSATRGENGLSGIAALLKGFVALGGYFLQLDVIDGEVLKRAQEDPEAYKTLSVRVSGWNARFVTLERRWQEMIIERTATGL